MYSVTLVYHDGRSVVVERDVEELAEAAHLALDLADRAGQVEGDGHGPPQWVKIFRGDRLEIAISVLAAASGARNLGR